MCFSLCNQSYVCWRHSMMRCIHAGCRCASSGVGLDAFRALAPGRISNPPHTQRGVPLSCHTSFLSADTSAVEPLQSHIMASHCRGAIDKRGIMRSYERPL